MAGTFKVRVWAIVGDRDAGKSTTISYLVSQFGRGQGGFRHVLLRSGGFLYVYARRMAWQEAKKQPSEVVQIVNRQAHNLMRAGRPASIGWINVLAALHFDPSNGCPSGHEYLSYFADQGWTIESLVLMDYDESRHGFYHHFGVPTFELYDSAAMVRQEAEHGWLVGKVRNHFGWA
jgi:hypothetical protein